MNYQIIKDKALLEEFIDWLPELQPDEKFYLSLLARSKYANDKDSIKTDKLSLKRFCSNKKYLLRKIKQLELEVGAYEFEGVPVPPESMALYITPNPRSIIKATKNIIIELQRKSWSNYDGYDPVAIALSEMQKSNGVVHYFDFDFDNVEFSEVAEAISSAVNLNACEVLQSRGGFHLLVNIKEVDSKYQKSWNPALSKIKGCDVRGTSGMIPVPGCTQGDFTPYFLF